MIAASDVAREAALASTSDDFAGIARLDLVKRIRRLLAQRAADVLTIQQNELEIARLRARVELLRDDSITTDAMSRRLREFADAIDNKRVLA